MASTHMHAHTNTKLGKGHVIVSPVLGRWKQEELDSLLTHLRLKSDRYTVGSRPAWATCDSVS